MLWIFLITRKVYSIIKGQPTDVFTLPLSIPYLWHCAALKQDITTGGKWGKEHWFVDPFPFCCCLCYWLVCLDRVLYSSHWSLTVMYPKMTLNSYSSCLCLWAEITSVSHYTQMDILFPITTYKAGVPYLSFPKKHFSQDHYRTNISDSLKPQMD